MRATVRHIHRFVFVVVLVGSHGVFCLAHEVRPFPAGATIVGTAGAAKDLTQEPVGKDLKLSQS